MFLSACHIFFQLSNERFLMNCSLFYKLLITYLVSGLVAFQKTKIRKKVNSTFNHFLLFWDDLINDIFQQLGWVLCIAYPDGLCTKPMILSIQGKFPKHIDSKEEMTEEEVGYLRVSSREQEEDTNALDQQRARLIDAGAKQIFKDVQAGKNDNRPDFQKLLALVKRGKIRGIIITRIDRITRSLITLKKLVDTLNEHEVSLVILDQKMDLGTAQGKLLLNMLGTLAEWEVDLLSERVKHGKKHQRNQQWANGSCPWGYKVIDHQYVLDQTPFLCLLSDRPDDIELGLVTDSVLLPGRTIAELARDCIDIFFERKGARRALKVIFQKYGIVKTGAKFNGTDNIFHWTIRGFTLWLKNPVLDGHTSYLQSKTIRGKRLLLPEKEWQIERDTHPDQRLFRDDEAAVVKTIFQTNTRNASGAFQKSLTGADNYRPFAYQIGLVYCEECGSRCTSKGNGTNDEYLYYACRHAGIGCSNHRAVKRRNIEESIIEALVEKSHRLSQEGLTSNKTFPSIDSEALIRLRAQLVALEQVPGFNSDIDGLKQKLRQQIEEEKNPFLSEDKVFDSSVEDLIRAGNNLAIWHLLNNDEKVEIYCKLLKRIYIRDGKVVSVVFNH